jgi:hypothetical protein
LREKREEGEDGVELLAPIKTITKNMKSVTDPTATPDK